MSTPNAEAAVAALSLPMDPLMCEAEVDRVCVTLASVTWVAERAEPSALLINRNRGLLQTQVTEPT